MYRTEKEYAQISAKRLRTQQNHGEGSDEVNAAGACILGTKDADRSIDSSTRRFWLDKVKDHLSQPVGRGVTPKLRGNAPTWNKLLG